MLKCLTATLSAVALAMVLPIAVSAGAVGVVEDDPRPQEPPKRICKKDHGNCTCKTDTAQVCSQWYQPGDGWVCSSTDANGAATNCSPL